MSCAKHRLCVSIIDGLVIYLFWARVQRNAVVGEVCIDWRCCCSDHSYHYPSIMLPYRNFVYSKVDYSFLSFYFIVHIQNKCRNGRNKNTLIVQNLLSIYFTHVIYDAFSVIILKLSSQNVTKSTQANHFIVLVTNFWCGNSVNNYMCEWLSC